MMVKRISIVEEIHNKNNEIAEENRRLLDREKLFAINLMASPGAGKTSLIELTLKKLRDQYRIAVIDGDVATSIDADRAEAAGATAVQINTGGECHLDAEMFNRVLPDIDAMNQDLLIIENVGNLICPASFQLGTHKSVLIASIPEGDDKPYKYPGMYSGVDALVVNKLDLLPHVTFNMEYFIQGVEILNPDLETFQISCTTGEGIDSWINWLRKQIEIHKRN